MVKAINNRLAEEQHYLKGTTIQNAFSRFFGRIISLFHEKIFREPASEEMIKFVRNLSYVGLGTIFASIFSFLYNIIAGRVLGPSGYGSFMLVQSIAMVLYIPMLLGLNTAMIKYCAENKDQHQQRRIISTAFIATTCLTVTSVLLYGTFRHQIATIF
jgi:Na+-driven multidrug efflux pump